MRVWWRRGDLISAVQRLNSELTGVERIIGTGANRLGQDFAD